MKVQACLNGEDTVEGDLEDTVLQYVHKTSPTTFGKPFSQNRKRDTKNTSRQFCTNIKNQALI